MADKFEVLKKLLTGKRAQAKTPSERPGMRAQKRAFDTFARAASSLYTQALQGAAERSERVRDYEEMDQSPEISKALDIYADDSTTYSEEGDVIEIVSDDERIAQELEELFYDRLDIEFYLWNWVRNMCKYGDHFNLLDIVENEGVLGAISLPVLEIEREEGFDGDPNSLRFRWTQQGNTRFENYQISHMRILGDDKFLPYGRSTLDPARRIWKQLQMAEDAMLIYRMTRAPERRVFKIDVANIPPNQVETYMINARDKLKRTPLVTESTGQIDLRFNPMPVASYTKIPLLDGRTITIKELAKEYEEGITNWVYSVQDETHRVVPGKVKWCGKNYTATKLTRVWLDNGKHIDTAPEHPFLSRDGSSKRADELEAGDSLMPLYRDKDNRGYERCYNPETQKYETTHKLVASDVYRKEYKTIDSAAVHHLNVENKDNKLNNSPNNLQVLNFWEHRKWHAEFCKKTLHRPEVRDKVEKAWREMNSSEEHRKIVSETNKKYKKAEHMHNVYNGTELHKSHNKIRSTVKTQKWEENREEYCKAMKWVFTDTAINRAREIIRDNPKLNRDKVFSKIRIDPVFTNEIISNNTRKINRLNSRTFFNNDFTNFKKRSLSYNHKVVKVETIEADEDVYCMTVLGNNNEEDRHNFATEDIFIMNSIDEDFFLPMRGDRGSSIETLPGGTNQGDIEDIEYLQQKMFIALGVPKSYLQSEEDLSGKSTLAQEDIKFARTIQRVQKIVVSELAKIGLIHLFLRGFDKDKIYEFDLKLTNPSTVMEMMQLELLDKRFAVASQMAETNLVSDLYVQRKVLQLSDHEINDVNNRLFDEARRKYILATLENEGAEAPADSEGGGGNPFGNDDDEEDETEGFEDKFGPHPGKIPDPTGTKDLPGVPNLVTDKENFDDGFRKKKRKRKDPFARGITSALKFDSDVNKILENLDLKKDKVID